MKTMKILTDVVETDLTFFEKINDAVVNNIGIVVAVLAIGLIAFGVWFVRKNKK